MVEFTFHSSRAVNNFYFLKDFFSFYFNTQDLLVLKITDACFILNRKMPLMIFNTRKLWVIVLKITLKQAINRFSFLHYVKCILLQILYKAKGEDVKHKYTMSPDLPQFLQAKCNAYNISDVSKVFAGM